jgi:hypothetical protein
MLFGYCGKNRYCVKCIQRNSNLVFYLLAFFPKYLCLFVCLFITLISCKWALQTLFDSEILGSHGDEGEDDSFWDTEPCSPLEVHCYPHYLTDCLESIYEHHTDANLEVYKGYFCLAQK